MKNRSLLVWALPFLLMLLVAHVAPLRAAEPSFADFDRRAKAGESLSVVFFGASLTWGANASDPQLTSFRALTGQRLEAMYPKAHFKFWDAAIGGTGSQLGVFRLDREVLRRKPDLVFLDFSANDDINSDNPETLASYESIVRRLVAEVQVPVVQVIFPFLWNVKFDTLDNMKRRKAHLRISEAYNTAVGDAIELAKQQVEARKITCERIWPVDGVHPCDEGYVLFADAAWTAFLQAVKTGKTCKAPAKMLYADTYMTQQRFRLATLAPLPQGWRVGKPNVVSAFFDMLMSRWQDDQAIASGRNVQAADAGSGKGKPQAVAPIKVAFQGSMVLLYGETTTKSGKYRVIIDGKLIEHPSKDKKQMLKDFDAGEFARMVGGNAHYNQVIVEGLPTDIEHTLEIQPIFAENAEQELRLESICVAGGKAKVVKAAL
jgi:lysophospholipase L1-like esterase